MKKIKIKKTFALGKVVNNLEIFFLGFYRRREEMPECYHCEDRQGATVEHTVVVCPDNTIDISTHGSNYKVRNLKFCTKLPFIVYVSNKKFKR